MKELSRIPPQNIDIEKSIIGQLLIDNKKVSEYIDSLRTEYFYVENHQIIFNAITDLLSKKQKIDILTLTNNLRESNKLEEIGGALTIMQLTSNIVSAANLSFHIEILRQKWLQRELISKCSVIIESCFESNMDRVNAEFESIQTEINNFFVGKLITRPLHENVEISIQAALARKQKGGRITGIDTGTQLMNNYNAGWQPGDVIIIAARPSMGKTAISLHYAISAAKNHKVIYFSLEMTTEKITDRILTSKIGINPAFYKTGAFENEYIDIMYQASDEFKNYNLEIIDNVFNLQKIKSIVKTKVSKKECDMVIIDYLGMVEPPARYKGNKVNEVGEISRELKQLAKETKIPIIELHQLNRDVEKRVGNLPQLSDLRDSGNIEQDADIIIFLYREDYYNKNNPDYTNKHEILNIVAKNRDGATGAFVLKHNEYINKFFEDGQTVEMPVNTGFDNEMPF